MTKRSNALIVGGTGGLGHAIAQILDDNKYKNIYILGKNQPETMKDSFIYYKIDLSKDNLDILNKIEDIDTLIISAGIGRLASFDTFPECEIQKTFQINAVSIIKILRRFYSKIAGDSDFYCAVVSSISGIVSSPLFSLYASTKAALARFIECVNIELEKEGTPNRILNVCPGVLEGTSFYGGKSDYTALSSLADEILHKMKKRDTLFIPRFEEIYAQVIKRYQDNAHLFGLDSYEYKKKSDRINNHSPIKIGYLSGTFDLFHIGHLNLLVRAKEYCDYLIVGVHKDASHKNKETFIPFDERYKIIQSIKVVDQVIESKPEDMDVYNDIQYHYLFVGSDYKGTERFERYEKYFKNKDVKIIYLPYTQETSSTKLRAMIEEKIKPSVFKTQ